MFPTPERIEKLISALSQMQTRPKATAKEFLHLLSLIASCLELILNARLYMRPIQLHLLSFWKPSYKTSKITSNVVVSYSIHYQGQFIMANTDIPYLNNRCFEDLVRRLPGQSVLSENLVSEETTYKCSRVGRSISRSKIFSNILERSECIDSIRLDNCCTVSEQTGRHKVSTDVLQNKGPLKLGNRKRDTHQRRKIKPRTS